MRQTKEWLILALAVTSLLVAMGFGADSSSETLTFANAGSSNLAGSPTLPRDFTLPIPLFATDSAWNQTAAGAAVLPDSDQQILVTYRVLQGDTTSLHPSGPADWWPVMWVNHDEYTIPIFRAGSGQQNVLICDYDGNLWWPHPKFGIEQEGGPVPVPAPAGMVRPASPQGTNSDGHLVLYHPDTFTAYDFWQATTVRDGPCQSQGSGLTGTTILEAGAADFFDVRGSGANIDMYSSARATGPPLLAGLILPEDVESGAISHALAFAIPGLRNLSNDPYEPLSSDYFYPASTTETDYYNTNPYALAAGQRIRLKQAIVDDSGDPIDENQLTPITRMFLTALRTHGAYLVDNAGGFTFYAEEIHTAVLNLSDDQINTLIGESPGTQLPANKTKWQIVIEKLNDEVVPIPFAYGPDAQNPATAQITTANFEVVEPATQTPTDTPTPTSTTMPTPSPTGTPTNPPCVLDGDLDGDGDVDIVDIMLVASHWHTAVGDPDYVAAYDLDGNGEIDIVDIMLVAIHWGENCTTPTTTPTATPTPTSTATPTPTPTTTATPTTAPFPDWAFEARLAGASFDSEMSNAEIDAKLQQAADDGVSVLVVDAPTGWSYTAWADTAEFNQVLALMRDRVFPRAHNKGLKVVWYLTGLELICEGCVNTGRDPAVEHPEWMQIDRQGNTVQFSGVQGVFWLNPDDLDAWLSPESPYRDFYIDRIEDIATAGADGLWIDVIYLLNSIGQFDDLWPSYDTYSQAAFQAAYGHATLPTKNWNDQTWRQFVRWRIESITDFVEDVAVAAQTVDPDLVFFTENWCMDSNYVTQYSQDPLEFIGNAYVATAHELEPVDQDNAGMANATYKQWRDYALMTKFAAAANKGKPGWILTYAGAVDDSLREAGVHLAEGANFYEAKGPEMVDDSTGSRPTVFPWLAANAGMAYHSTSLAEVAVWYSPRTRDFVDGENAGDDKFDYVGTTYINEYRTRAQDLMKVQIPFDIVTGQWSLAELARYTWLVLPNAACLSDAEAALLYDYANASGKLAVTGDTGSMDEWCQTRATNALDGVTTYLFSAVTSDVLTTDLPTADKERVLIEARTGTDATGPFLIIPLANFNKSQVYSNVGITVRLPAGFTPTTVTWNAPHATGGTLSYSVNGGRLSVTLPTLDTAAAVVIRGSSSPSTSTPTVTPTGTNTPTPTATPTATATATATPSPTATSETGVDKWSLWTGATQLRGANIWQRRVYPELDGTTFLGPGPVGPPFTQSDFDSLVALGANYVNISHPGLFTENPPYVLDQDIQDNLDSLLAMIEGAGMFAVISARTGPGRSDFTFYWDGAGDWFDESYLNDSMWQDQAAQDAWVAMWAYTAQRYKDNPIVVGYDLMVEPNSNEVGSHALYDALDIWDPDEFYATYGGTLYDWNQLYPRITTAIRQVDTDTPILIGGNGYSAVDWLPYIEPTGDPRTVYTIHQYEPFKYTHQDPGAQDCTYPGWCDVDWDEQDEWFDQVWLDSLLSTVNDFKTTHGVPVSVNEFGVMRWEPGADQFMDDEMNLFQQHGMNHALWVWDPAWEPWTQEEDAFNFRHGPNPNNHTDVASSDLIDVIVDHWGRNTVRP